MRWTDKPAFPMRELKKSVLTLLDGYGKQVNNLSAIKGNNGDYTLVVVSDLQVFLYEDGEAGITSNDRNPRVDIRYEIYDFDSFDDLRNRLLSDLKDLL